VLAHLGCARGLDRGYSLGERQPCRLAQLFSAPDTAPSSAPAGRAACGVRTREDDMDELNEIEFFNDGVSLFAVESGSGLPIVLLHGGLATHQACRLFAAPLASRFRLITPDLRASGRSVFRGELTWDVFADDVAALLRHLGLSRAVIGGISFGAGVAVRIALRHPTIVERLVILHPVFAGDTGLTAAQTAALRAMHEAGKRALGAGVAALYPLFDTLPAEIRARARAVVATYDPESVEALTRFMASGAQPFAAAAELARIEAPALVIPGVDPQHPHELAEVYRRHLRRCTVVETPDLATAIEAFVG
jgi:pimeloyl-ACP methyl ester carboxylesterase